jgi:hypothetical protein
MVHKIVARLNNQDSRYSEKLKVPVLENFRDQVGSDALAVRVPRAAVPVAVAHVFFSDPQHQVHGGQQGHEVDEEVGSSGKGDWK